MAFKYGITIEQAKQLKFGDYLYSNHFIYKTQPLPKMWKVNGKIKIWKRDPYRIQIPLKYGLYYFAYLCHGKINNAVYMHSITIELRDVELTEERAIEVLKEKGIIK